MTAKEKLQKYGYLLWILYLPVYLTAFFLMERVFVPDKFTVIHCALDDMIPFSPFFITGYTVWFPFMVVMGIWLLIKDIPAFCRYMKFIAISFSASIIIFLIFPTCQELRPDTFANDNIFTKAVQYLYSIDTSTNVLPSIHVVGSMMVPFAAFNTESIKKRWVKALLIVIAVFICASTLLIKQHSVLDVIAGAVLAFAVYPLAYGDILKKKYGREKQ